MARDGSFEESPVEITITPARRSARARMRLFLLLIYRRAVQICRIQFTRKKAKAEQCNLRRYQGHSSDFTTLVVLCWYKQSKSTLSLSVPRQTFELPNFLTRNPKMTVHPRVRSKPQNNKVATQSAFAWSSRLEWFCETIHVTPSRETFYRLCRIPTIARGSGLVVHPGALAGARLVEVGVELEESNGIARCHRSIRACVDHGVSFGTCRRVVVIHVQPEVGKTYLVHLWDQVSTSFPDG